MMKINVERVGAKYVAIIYLTSSDGCTELLMPSQRGSGASVEGAVKLALSNLRLALTGAR